jgi:4-hydroxybenzoate polyprenyltransferase
LKEKKKSIDSLENEDNKFPKFKPTKNLIRPADSHSSVTETDKEINTIPKGAVHRFKNKINGFIKLIRPKSLLPTIFLCGAGGWIMNPSVNNLMHSKSFIISTACTLLILTSSMVINDVYDVNIDKINNPSRPLVNGDVKIYEAIILNLVLLGSVEYLSINFLEEKLQLIINFVIFVVGIYTSLLKRIPLIKNISCAAIVSLTIFFSGLASYESTLLLTENKNFNILSVLMNIIFYGSLSNEILLDIRDCEGDKINHIYTLPVIFGKKFAMLTVNIITNVNIFANVLSIMYLINYNYGLLLIVFCLPLSINLVNLQNQEYSDKNIMKFVNSTTNYLFFILLYFCFLANG